MVVWILGLGTNSGVRIEFKAKLTKGLPNNANSIPSNSMSATIIALGSLLQVGRQQAIKYNLKKKGDVIRCGNKNSQRLAVHEKCPPLGSNLVSCLATRASFASSFASGSELASEATRDWGRAKIKPAALCLINYGVDYGRARWS